MIRRVLPIAVTLGLLGAAARGATLPPGFDTLIAAAKTEMMRDPQAAQRSAQRAAAMIAPLATTVERDLAIATARWLSGEAALRNNDIDAAAADIASALAIVQRRAPGSKLNADLLLAHGGVNSARASPDKALSDYLAAHSIYVKLKDARQQAIALLDIGSIYQDAGDYERVLNYCSQAAELNSDDRVITLTIINNRANALQQLDRYKEAEREYQRALVIATQLDNPLLQAKILKNIALAQIDAKELASAKVTVERGLKLARDADAAAWRPFLLGAAARIALKEGRSSDAADLVDQGFKAASGPTDTQIYRSMHDTAYNAYAKIGKSREALSELETLKKLDDEARSLAASTNSALLAARFDFASQNARIATLRTARLQQDIALSELRARQTLITLGSALLVVLGGLVFLIVNLRSVRRSRDAVAAANAELTATNLQLEDALRAKSKFLATTSHEIRTPLNGILGMAQVILAEPTLARDVRERVELLQGAGTTMRALVDDILDFASLDAGRLDIQDSDADLPAVLNEVVGFWRGRATRDGLTVTLDVASDLRLIRVDVRRLRQILFNLLSNAIKFTPAGSVALRACAEADGDGERLAIAVEDSGIGIPSAELDRIFEEFHQVDTERTRQFSGTGLGLAISRALAGAMGGTIDVASEEGKGSVFTVRLPLRRVDDPVPVARPAGQRSLSAARLAVVAGNPLADATLRALLSDRVARYASIATCDDAASRAEIGDVDIVLVEGGALQPSGAGGLTTLRALAQRTAAAGVPVGLLWTLVPDKPTGLDPRLHVIAKPVGGEALVSALEQILTNWVDMDVGTSPKDVSTNDVDGPERRGATARAQ